MNNSCLLLGDMRQRYGVIVIFIVIVIYIVNRLYCANSNTLSLSGTDLRFHFDRC